MRDKFSATVPLMMLFALWIVLCAPHTTHALEFQGKVTGDIASKSVVYSGHGLFFAQNMMYRHTVTVYDAKGNLRATIPDRVKLSDFGYTRYQGTHRGSPVEAAFTPDGKYAWVSNYQMYGSGFNNPGNDGAASGDFDKSFVYKINTTTFTIDAVVEVGSVPKYVAIDPAGKLLLVSNWSSRSVSVIDLATERVVREITIGNFPRGIAISPGSKYAYIAVMGSYDIAILNLADYSLEWIKGVGRAPQHLVLSPDGKTLYASINGEGKLVKIDVPTRRVVKKIATGNKPRSMVITPNGAYLYVVNYKSHTVSKVRTADMAVVDTARTDAHPIGIAYDPDTQNIWVACYSGSIMIFHDKNK